MSFGGVPVLFHFLQPVKKPFRNLLELVGVLVVDGVRLVILPRIIEHPDDVLGKFLNVLVPFSSRIALAEPVIELFLNRLEVYKQWLGLFNQARDLPIGCLMIS
jgi:hypothetical protein